MTLGNVTPNYFLLTDLELSNVHIMSCAPALPSWIVKASLQKEEKVVKVERSHDAPLCKQ